MILTRALASRLCSLLAALWLFASFVAVVNGCLLDGFQERGTVPSVAGVDAPDSIGNGQCLAVCAKHCEDARAAAFKNEIVKLDQSMLLVALFFLTLLFRSPAGDRLPRPERLAPLPGGPALYLRLQRFAE
ncbi:MAG TPA: hypothetical protein VNN09_13685 [Candidatus Competibacteraceae bacterium]|nr:hypothetical protein [Candidatus Competibacteraceae bacterium]